MEAIKPVVSSCPAQVQGGGLRDSFLVDGVAFKKTFSYAGFEMQPRSFTDPPILLLNIELELKAEKENAEVRTAPRSVPWDAGEEHSNLSGRKPLPDGCRQASLCDIMPLRDTCSSNRAEQWQTARNCPARLQHVHQSASCKQTHYCALDETAHPVS